MSLYSWKKSRLCELSPSKFACLDLFENWYATMTTTNMTVTMETRTYAHGDPDDDDAQLGYIVPAGVICAVAMVTIIVLLAYRYFQKRSGPLWITKFYHQDQYSTMKNDELKEDQFILGFSNPIMDSTDQTDNSVEPLAYRPLDADKQSDEKDQHLLQYKFLFPREKLTFGDVIGSGWFGKVYKGEATRIIPGVRKTKIIIKKLHESSTSEERKRFLDEIALYKSFCHENVLELLGVSSEQQPYIVVFEFYPLGNLKEYLLSHRSDSLSTTKRLNPLKMSIDIGSGLEFLHSKYFYHSDLAARNCVVNSDLTVKIGDYGISRDLYPRDYFKHPKSRDESLPIRWLNPESVCVDKDSGISVKTLTAKENVWSFGVTLWEIIEYGRQPYEDLTDDDVIQTVIVDRLYQLPEPRDTGILATQLYDMIKWCWMESDRRPAIEDMLFFLKGLTENIDDLYAEAENEEQEKPDTHSTHNEPHQPSEIQPTQTSPHKEELLREDASNVNNVAEVSTCNTADMSEKEAEISEKTKNDVEITAIVDEHHDVPVTVILSESSQENELRRTAINDDLNQERNEWSTPITHIGGPSDGLTEYEQRIAEQATAEPSSSNSDSVIIEDCPSGYVVLPGERMRRKSSILKSARTQSKGHTVHFPANILALRVIHLYQPEECEEEEQEEEEDQEDMENTGNQADGEPQTKHCGSPPSSEISFELPSSDERIFLNTDCSQVEDETEIGSALILDRPTSPVERRMKKATRRKPLSTNTADEWLFSLEQENSN